MNLIGILPLIIACWTTAGPENSTIYVAPNGLDSNPGTKEQPLASLTGARDIIRKLDIQDSVLVKIAPGDYFMTLPLELTAQDVMRLRILGIPAFRWDGCGATKRARW
jgi:hypothetical protein